MAKQKMMQITTMHWEHYLRYNDMERAPIITIRFPKPSRVDPPYDLKDILKPLTLVHFLTFMEEDSYVVGPVIECADILEAGKTYNALDAYGSPIAV